MDRIRWGGICLALTLAIGTSGLRAQSTEAAIDATRFDVARDLDDGWKVMRSGDDISYARPNFDDSGWNPFDLHMSVKDLQQEPHSQTVWYRLRLKVDPTRTGLGLREETLARAFEIYVNGERLITSGQVAPLHRYTFDSPILAPIPSRMVATGELVIAVRIGVAKTDWSGLYPGLSAGNLTLGPASSLADEDWLKLIGDNFTSMLDSITTVALGLVALALFLSQRRRLEYFWVFGQGVVQLAELPVKTICLFHNIPIGWRFFNATFLIATPFLLVAMYFAFVGRKIGPRFRVFLVLAGVMNALSLLANQGLIPNLPSNFGLLSNLPFVILLAIFIPVILLIDLRRGNREAGILLIPAVAFSLFIYANYALAFMLYVPAWSGTAIRGLSLIQRFPAGPFSISLNNVSGILSTVALAIIMVLRASTTSRVQAQLEAELEAAREVQQVILPEQIDSIPGFEIESVYVPAQQVGGDFFQVVPIPGGGLLLVIGDVAGKGLPAAMLVSVMVGAIRATAEYTHAPQEVLSSLNERLVGRSRGGFSTALAAYFSPDGFIEIANAGHLSPYIDGQELELEGALPLGILGRSAYSVKRVKLAAGSRITFYSDGVVEAQNTEGELFGFDRSQQIAIRPATEIAATAKRFGQSDDITVVAITRTVAAVIDAAA